MAARQIYRGAHIICRIIQSNFSTLCLLPVGEKHLWGLCLVCAAYTHYSSSCTVPLPIPHMHGYIHSRVWGV